MSLHGRRKSGSTVSALLGALAAGVLVMAALAAGCGASAAAEKTATQTDSDTYSRLLADRYDDVFPDDRVLTVRIVMDDADWQSMQVSAMAKDYYKADIWIDNELVQDVAVRTKGSSSLSQALSSGSFRAGLKVDFNFFNSARNYHGIKKLCYSNGFSDPTLMKEFLGYEVMAAVGIPTPRACFVDVWVNDAHLGVYTQVEAVDARFVQDNFADGNGNLYKPETLAGRLDWTESDVVAQAAAREDRAAAEGSPAAGAQASPTTTTTAESFNVGGGDLEEIIERLGEGAGWIPGRVDTSGKGGSTTTTAGLGRDGGMGPGMPPGMGGLGFMGRDTDLLTSVGLKTNEDKADYSGLYELLEVLNSEPSEVSTHDLEAVLDVDEVLRYLAVSTALVHLDNYTGMGHNYYLYEDGGKFSIIPWDLNMSFGGFNSGLNQDQILNFFIDEPTAASVDQYPLVEQLISEPEYLQTYHGYLQDLIEGPFSVEWMTTRINEIADLIRPYVEKDDGVSLEQFEQGLKENLSGQTRAWAMGGMFVGLAYFVENRVASIAAQLSGEREASKGDGSGNSGTVGPGGPGGGPGMGGNLPPGGMNGQRWPQGAAPGAGEMPASPNGG